MKVADAVREYVVYKRSLGMTYKGRALKLNAFARFVGPIDLYKVTPEMVRNFLDGHGAVTTEWFNKFWVLNTFFRFAIARGYATENPLTSHCPHTVASALWNRATHRGSNSAATSGSRLPRTNPHSP
jgi:integrase/recombinase XerD